LPVCNTTNKRNSMDYALLENKLCIYLDLLRAPLLNGDFYVIEICFFLHLHVISF
jgi:hypothetical protein